MMQTNVDGVFAGGDVVTFPLALRGNKKVNIPHWQMAHVHGKHQEQINKVSFSSRYVMIIQYSVLILPLNIFTGQI